MNTLRTECETAPLIPHVPNEFGTLKTAILGSFSNPEFYAQAFSGDEATERAFLQHAADPDIREHYAYTELLRKRGIRLLYPHHPTLPLTAKTFKQWNCSDAYCRDMLGAVDTQAVFSHVAEFRQTFREHYRHIFEQIEPAHRTETDAHFTWGNALVQGDRLLVGLEHEDFFPDITPHVSREKLLEILQTHDARNRGQRSIGNILRTIGSTRQLLVIPMNANSDLDLCVAPLPRRKRGDKRKAVLHAPFIHPAAEAPLRSQFDELMFCNDEFPTLPCNLLWLDPETPVVSKSALHMRQILRTLGYNPIALSLEELSNNFGNGAVAGDPGGWRCMTGVLARGNDYEFD